MVIWIVYPPRFVPAESSTMIVYVPVVSIAQDTSVAVVGPQMLVPFGRTTSWGGNSVPEVFTRRTRIWSPAMPLKLKQSISAATPIVPVVGAAPKVSAVQASTDS